MGEEGDTRDRVIALERDVAHLSDKVEELTSAVKELTTALAHTRGGWKVLIAVLTACGTIGGAVVSLVPWSSMIR